MSFLITFLSLYLHLNLLVYDQNIFLSSSEVFSNVGLSSEIFRKLRKRFGKCLETFFWSLDTFWKIFGNLWKMFGNLQKIAKNVERYLLWEFYIIKRKLHSGLEIHNFSSCVEKYFSAPAQPCNILYILWAWGKPCLILGVLHKAILDQVVQGSKLECWLPLGLKWECKWVPRTTDKILEVACKKLTG